MKFTEKSHYFHKSYVWFGNVQNTMQRLFSDLFWDTKSMENIFQARAHKVFIEIIRLWWNSMARLHHWHETDTVAEGYRSNVCSGSHVGFLQSWATADVQHNVYLSFCVGNVCEWNSHWLRLCLDNIQPFVWLHCTQLLHSGLALSF